MKKLLILLGAIILGFAAKAQTYPVVTSPYPIVQNIGSDSAIVKAKSALQAISGFVNGFYPDTSAPNLIHLKNYPYAQIMAGNTLWVRDSTASRWISQSTQTTNIQNGIISGGIVTWDSLLVFDVSPAIYVINGLLYSSPFTVITLDPANDSLPRQDAFALTISSTAINITGTPAANPQVPSTDPLTESYLTSAYIAAGDTIPSGIVQPIIYDENVEWTVGGTATTNPNNTVLPVHLLKAIDQTGFTAGQTITFIYGSTVDLNDYGALKFYIRLKSQWPGGTRMQVDWLNSGSPISQNSILLGGPSTQFNFFGGTFGAYQVVQIPIAAWRFTSTVADELRITFVGSNVDGFYLDWVQLQGGITQPVPSNGGTVTSVAVSGNIVITPVVSNPNTTVNVALNLANACAGCFLGNQTVSPTTPTYAPINLSNNGSFTGLLNPSFLDTAVVDGSFLQSISGVAQWVSLPTGYDTTFVEHPLVVIPGVNNDTLTLPIGVGTTSDSAIVLNRGTGLLEMVKISGSGSTPTLQEVFDVESDLAVLTVNNVISTGSNNLQITGAGSASGVLEVVASAGTAIVATGNSGGTAVSGLGDLYGLQGESLNGTGILSHTQDGTSLETLTNSTSVTNAVLTDVRIRTLTQGTAANGLGGSIDFTIQNVTLGEHLSAQLKSYWANATTASRTSQFDIAGVNNATTETFANFQTGGIVRVNNLADTLATQAYARSVGGGGGGGGGSLANFYLADSSLSSDRTVDLNGKFLKFNNSDGQTLFDLESGSAVLKAISPDNLASNSFVGVFASNDGGIGFQLLSNDNDGPGSVQILGDAVAKSIAYTADTHTFTGNVGINITPTTLFEVNNGSRDLISVNSTSFETDVSADDGTANAALTVLADLVGTSVLWNLGADNGSGSNAIMTGDALAKTVTAIAANGFIIPHLVGGGSAPSIAAGAGAGTTPTVTVGSGSTDEAGYVNITTGTLPTGTNATVATVTFAAAYSAAPTSIILTPANSLTALLSGVTMVCVPQSSITANGFSLVSGTTGLTGATGYKFYYIVIQ